MADVNEKAVDQKEKDEQKEKNAARNAKRNDAFAKLKELCDKNEDPKYREALTVIRPSLYGASRGGGGGGTSMRSKVIAHIVSKGQCSEDELFKHFKVGRKETNQYIKQALRKEEPANRVWISFDPSNGIYKMQGKGAKAPANWKGYIPEESEITLK